MIVTLTTYIMLAFNGEIIEVQRGPEFSGPTAMTECLLLRQQREFTFFVPDGQLAVHYCDPKDLPAPTVGDKI